MGFSLADGLLHLEGFLIVLEGFGMAAKVIGGYLPKLPEANNAAFGVVLTEVVDNEATRGETTNTQLTILNLFPTTRVRPGRGTLGAKAIQALPAPHMVQQHHHCCL